MKPTKSLLLVLLPLLLLLTSCETNVFESAYEPGTSNDPEELLLDAEAALQNGDATEAEAILRRALEQAPDNFTVRIRLVGAIYANNDISVLDLMELVDQLDNAGRTAQRTSERTSGGKGAQMFDVCSHPDGKTGAFLFDPTDTASFRSFVQNRAVFDEIRTILDPIIGAATNPDGTINFSIITSTSASTNDLQLMFALSSFGFAYPAVFSDDGNQEWYETRNGLIMTCMSSEEALLAYRNEVCPLPITFGSDGLLGFKSAVTSMIMRQNSIGTTEALELRDQIKKTYNELQLGIGGFCLTSDYSLPTSVDVFASVKQGDVK